MTTNAPDREARAIAAIRAAAARPTLPFRALTGEEIREDRRYGVFNLAVSATFAAIAGTTVAAPVIYFHTRPDMLVGFGVMALVIAGCSVFTLINGLGVLRVVRQQNPVLVEALHRGDYADFAVQLRRDPRPERWRARDVRRALPLIDQWARETGQA